MIHKFVIAFYLLLIPFTTYANDNNDVYSVSQLLERNPDNTECATNVFNRALADTANLIADPEIADSEDIDAWTRYAFAQRDVLTAVLDCPELKNAKDEDTIVFNTVSYTFSNGRKIDVNYETQKKVILQKLKLTEKRDLPGELVNPNIYSDAESGNTWTNVDPAWYAILVAEHGSLDAFVGKDKNNVVALKYIENNIGKLYPRDHATPFHAQCTSKTAIAGDTDMINRAVTATVGGPTSKYTPESDQEKAQADAATNNDYYVMGDKNLGWIMWAEIATDAILTVVTWGGYEVVKGVVQAARGTRAFRTAQKALNTLKGSRIISRYTRISREADTIEQAIKLGDNISDSAKLIDDLGRTNAQHIKSLTNELETLTRTNAKSKQIKEVQEELTQAKSVAENLTEASKNAEQMKEIENTLKNGRELTATKTKELNNLDQRIAKLNEQLHRGPLKKSESEKIKTQLKNLEQEKKTIQNQKKLKPEEVTQLQNQAAELKDSYTLQLNELKDKYNATKTGLAASNDVKIYKDVENAKREMAHNAYLLRQSKNILKAKNRGILPVRTFKAAKSLRQGLKTAKKMDKSVKLIRANTSGLSTKINDWLFHNTMKNLTAAAKLPATLVALNFLVKFAGGMYDKTDTSTDEYTNNIDMKPYLLLGADNLEGFENVINYGMWLFWTGSSTSPANDDAAFLQAMDFAEKFHQDLIKIQDEYDVMACDVDIYVVRPIIRNVGTDNEELYYLFMNETPWTTHGYNEPNNGDRPSSIPLRETDASAMHPSNETINRASGNTSYTEPPYNGTIIGQSCTPPSMQTGNFTNAILTTGRYANYPAFEKAMITKFRTEGGCVDHPADSGGYTCYGVSSKYFPQVKEPGFSRADAEDIAFNNYYKKYELDKLPDAISGDVFMAMWGMGRANSIGLLQRILGVPQTNLVDETTINAAKNYTGNLRTEFLDAREQMFRAGQKEFRQGWLNALELYRSNGCHTIVHKNLQ